MAAPSYAQIQSFNAVAAQLKEAAMDEFMDDFDVGMTRDEVVELATRIAQKYSYLGCELGAQWYDLCSELAGLEVDPAYLPEVDVGELEGRAQAAFGRSQGSSLIGEVFNYYLQNQIERSIRMTGDANLWRDYERGTAGGRWARVPVGDTCAWCLMLASQGAWYLSEETAKGIDPGHYHDGCDCVAVYHADPDSIAGYTKLAKYKGMYYDAENARLANANGKRPYDDDLAWRVNHAREVHEQKRREYLEALARGENPKEVKEWTVYNETLIVMRYQNEGLK